MEGAMHSLGKQGLWAVAAGVLALACESGQKAPPRQPEPQRTVTVSEPTPMPERQQERSSMIMTPRAPGDPDAAKPFYQGENGSTGPSDRMSAKTNRPLTDAEVLGVLTT